jgi:hypothetical protein
MKFLSKDVSYKLDDRIIHFENVFDQSPQLWCVYAYWYNMPHPHIFRNRNKLYDYMIDLEHKGFKPFSG